MRTLRRLLLVLALLWAVPALAQVSHDAASESHTGTTCNTATSFNWSHSGGASPEGVIVFVIGIAGSGVCNDTAVTYGGSSLSLVSGGEAAQTGTEPGCTRTWFLGSSVPTGTQTVEVTRSGTNAICAYAATVDASGNTEAYGTGAVLETTIGTLAEVTPTDGSPGSNSLRYAALNSGLAAVPAVGGSTTALHDMDFGSRVHAFARETTAGQGARSVGWSSGTSDDRMNVYIAVREATAPTCTAGLNLPLLGVGGCP